MTPQEFAELMAAEIEKNTHKGQWSEWWPTQGQAVAELSHHVVKLCLALGAGKTETVLEHCADVGNIAMKIAEVYGK